MSLPTSPKVQKMSSASLKQDKARATALLLALLDKRNPSTIHATTRTLPKLGTAR